MRCDVSERGWSGWMMMERERWSDADLSITFSPFLFVLFPQKTQPLCLPPKKIKKLKKKERHQAQALSRYEPPVDGGNRWYLGVHVCPH